MSNISNTYASYMTHYHKYEHRIQTYDKAFSHILGLINNGKFIDCNIDTELSKYPKYPNIYKFFQNTSQFHMWNIQNATADTVELLSNHITNPDVLLLKKKLDHIPTEITKIINDIYLQYSYTTTVSDIFNTKQHFHDFSAIKETSNYYNSTIELPFNENFTKPDSSFIHTFLFDFLFRQLLKNTSNISSALHVYSIDVNVFNNDVLLNTFKNVIGRLKIDFFNQVTNIILQSLYKMNNIDPDIIEVISKELQKNAETIIDLFENYLTQISTNQIGRLLYYFLNLTYLSLSSKLISDMHGNSSFFNLDYIQQLAASEDKQFDRFMNNKSRANIKNYLYCSYFYKFWPIKYVNILPIIMEQYTNDIIKPSDSFAYTQNELESLVKFCINGNNLNHENMLQYFTNTITPDYLINLVNDEKIYDFTYFLYLTEIFDGFTKSSQYEDLVQSIYSSVFLKLRELGQVSNDFNWCQCFTLFNLFFKTFFRHQVSQGHQFQGLVGDFKYHMEKVLSNETGDDKYEFRIKFDENKIKSLFSNVINSNMSKIHIFTENMFTSSLTNKIDADVSSYFLR